MIKYDTLMEVFDKPVAWREMDSMEDEGDTVYSFQFKIDTTMYLANVMINPNYEVTVDFYGPKGTDLTGMNKHQFKVYSTVFDIVKTLKKRGHIQSGYQIHLIGTMEKQDKMYAVLLKYLIKKGFVELSYGKYYIK
jgi:hypothetical protein